MNKYELPTVEWEPLDDRMVIQRVTPEKISPGGIYIPDTAQEKANKGIVIAVGEFVTHNDGDNYAPRKGRVPKPGDVIMFGKYSGAEFDYIINGKTEELLIIRLTDVMAIREKTAFDGPIT